MTFSLNITVVLSRKYVPIVKGFDLIWMSCIKIFIQSYGQFRDHRDFFAIFVTVVVTTMSCVKGFNNSSCHFIFLHCCFF